MNDDDGHRRVAFNSFLPKIESGGEGTLNLDAVAICFTFR
jgi:hypothetical protein